MPWVSDHVAVFSVLTEEGLALSVSRISVAASAAPVLPTTIKQKEVVRWGICSDCRSLSNPGHIFSYINRVSLTRINGSYNTPPWSVGVEL